MKHNMGSLDKGVRVIVAVVLAIFIATGHITGLAAIILGALAVIFIVTSLIGFCPCYALLHINTGSKTA